jgi:protocatechuate 3,4-dioxygenase beta subunit
MFRFTRFLIFLSIVFLVVFTVANAQTPQRDNRPRTASVSGRVTIAGKPAVNAKVAVTEVKHNPALGTRVTLGSPGSEVVGDYVVLTDAEGRYNVTNLPEGRYEAQESLGAYVKEKPSSKESLVESFSLDEGESRENVDFQLVRGGVITGRVTDADGRPLIARTVSVQGVDEQGRKTIAGGFQDPLSMLMDLKRAQTDDRGVYRIFGLRGGRYLVGAGGESDIFSGATRYPRTWHPDAADENQAKVVEVTSGGEVTGVDIRLGAVKKTYEASGRVVDDETGKPIAGAGVYWVKVKAADGGAAIGELGFGMFSGNAKADEQGNFRLVGLAPGQYQLSLAEYQSFLTGGVSNYYSDWTKFEIHGGDVAGVEIRAKFGATISGVAVIEDADQSAKSSLSQTMLMAYSMPASPQEVSENGISFSLAPVSSRIGSDGGFSLKGIRPGRVMMHAMGATGRALKITRIERGGVEMTNGIDITGREDITGVRMVFGKGSGVIRGQVQIIGGALSDGWRVTVTAHSEKNVADLDSSDGYAMVDGKGRFVIEGVLPGEYELTLVAEPVINPNSPPQSTQIMPVMVTQKVVVTKGQEAHVTVTLDLSKKNREEK